MRATGPSQSPLLLLDVIDVLDRSQIPYVIVGAIAAAYHGAVRASRDADAVVSLPAAEVPVLAENLRKLGLEVDVRKGHDEDPIRQVLTLTDKHANRVDLLLGVRGMEKAVLDRCRNTTLLGSSVRIIGAEDFIAMKVFAGSAKDLGDVQAVLEVSGETLDMPLLRRVTRRYGAEEAKTLTSMLRKYLPGVE
jgi:predicted nucleotidyltransferase